MAVSAVDVIFVARLGTVDLAAATLAVFLFNLLMYAIIGLGSASAALIAAELGARSHAVREVRRSFRMALWVAAIAALPVVAILLNGEHLLLLVGQDPEVARRAGGFPAHHRLGAGTRRRRRHPAQHRRRAGAGRSGRSS